MRAATTGSPTGTRRARGPTRPRPRRSRRRLLVLGLVALLAGVGLILGVPFRVGSSPEELGAVVSPTEFLTHWQFVGSAAGTTPLAAPRVWSASAATPTRLGRVSASALIDAGVGGDAAVVWTFNETVGMAVSTELELAFTVHYTVGGTAHTAADTVYVETSALALTGTVTFSVYWDSGGTAAVTFGSQFVLSQACAAVGTCP